MSDKSWFVRAMPTVRLVTFASLLFCSIVVLGASGHYINTTLHGTLFIDGFRAWPQAAPDGFSVFDLAVALLTLIVIKPMLIIDFCRRGAFTSLILTEVIVIGIFIIVWGAAAGLTTAIFPPVGALCSENTDVPILTGACTDIQLAMAFGWLAWILLLAYFVALITFAIMSSRNGQSAWKSSVRETSSGSGRSTMAPSTVYKNPAMMASASNEQFLMKSQVPQGYGGGAVVAPTLPYQPNAPYDPHVAQGALGYAGAPRYNSSVAQV